MSSSAKGSDRRSDQDNSPVPKSGALSDRPTFTFIDHDEDLASKQITGANARKAIRSHVMRDVRRRERLAGRKRPSKRGERAGTDSKPKSTAASRKSSPTSTPTEKEDKDVKDGALLRVNTSSSFASSGSSSPSTLESSTDLTLPSKLGGKGFAAWSDDLHISKEKIHELSAQLFDPFLCLPGADDLPYIIDTLVQYCASILIPTTFPVESKQSQERNERMGFVFSSAISDAGSFYSFMGFTAAHRAVLGGKKADLIMSASGENRYLMEPEYYVLNARCIKEVNAKIQDPKGAISDDAFQTVINLVSGAMLTGCFEEATMHLKALKRMVDMRGPLTDGGWKNSEHIYFRVLICDLKHATGMPRRPAFPPLMESFAIAPEILARIAPEPFSPLHNTGLSLTSNPYIGPMLVNAVSGLRDLMFFDDYNSRDKGGLTSDDHDLFRASSHMIEHEILDYPYRLFSVENEDSFKINLHPIEAVTRAALICYINTCFIVSPPASGLGRALARNLRNALSHPALTQFYSENRCLDLLIWAYFLGAHLSRGQLDRPWMIQGLANILTQRGLRTWPDAIDIMRGYLYMPRIHEDSFIHSWDDAMALIGSTAMEG
ncbi:hypothetical protein FQN54_002248 [Arachnomyces sp. PD_36]|nr:hypothetical protein FQN54_002248 [Arachnomyces sp. PD_36]